MKQKTLDALGITEENGNFDISQFSDEALELIGYRIPTENKYSMIPIKIKGFLPSHGGTNIMLPSEITAIAGLDFDVDKMYLMMKELTVKDGKIVPIGYDVNAKVKSLKKEERANQLIDIN
jgi:hypothetical protein